MFRFVVLVAMLFAFPALADYQVNLSALDFLTIDNETEDLPLVEAPARPRLSLPKTKPESKPQTAKEQPVIDQPSEQITNNLDENKQTEENTPAELKDEAPSEPAKPEIVVIEPVVETSSESTGPENIIPAEETSEPAVSEDKTSASSDNSEHSQEEIELSVPTTNEIALIPFNENDTANSVQIIFDDNSDVLTDKAISELDAFAEKNKDDPTGKILIEAYHYNSGNGFARKRTSLNRAVNVRSYLLNRGFKSFNIQIINTEEEVLQNNTVVSR